MGKSTPIWKCTHCSEINSKHEFCSCWKSLMGGILHRHLCICLYFYAQFHCLEVFFVSCTQTHTYPSFFFLNTCFFLSLPPFNRLPSLALAQMASLTVLLLCVWKAFSARESKRQMVKVCKSTEDPGKYHWHKVALIVYVCVCCFHFSCTQKTSVCATTSPID